jgi:hypothetical protein
MVFMVIVISSLGDHGATRRLQRWPVKNRNSDCVLYELLNSVPETGGSVGKYPCARKPPGPIRSSCDVRCSGCCERRADQGGEGLRAGLFHDGRAMVVNGSLANTEISGDVFAWMAGEHEVQDLALSRGQARNA